MGRVLSLQPLPHGKAQLEGLGPRSIQLSWLDKGTFASAWVARDGRVYLFVAEEDHSRHVLVDARRRLQKRDPGNPHLPEIEHLGDVDVGVERQGVFRMPRYRTAYDVIQKLIRRRGREAARRHPLYRRALTLPQHDVDPEQTFPRLPRRLGTALRVLAETAERYDPSVDWYWDTGAENVAFDRFGRIVLLDVLVDGELVD